MKIRPTRDVELEGLEVRLFGYERTNDEDASPVTTVRYDETATVEAAAGLSLGGGMTRAFPGTLSVPEDAAYSLELKWNQLRWRLEVAIRFGGVVNWRSRRLLCVSPEGAEPRSGAG